MSLLSVWEKAQESIKNHVGDSTYETWFASLNIKEKDPKTLLIETPDEFYKNWIDDNYLALIKKKVQEFITEDISIELSVDSRILKESHPDQFLITEKERVATNQEAATINSRFSFNSFVVGPSNRFAHAACMAVAESPAKAYNPLFIYGPVGLGKTHLMQAITQEIKKLHPDMTCAYLSSEKFTNELIDAIRHRSTTSFRQKYRNIDVLLIDDIHFIAGKESTQEEFFHTFNTLHNNRKQIIISSDRPPKEIANLEERLVSRFAWGLITDIQPPDFETRVAILRKKCEREPIQVPDDVIFFIAEQIKTNIRELEGALIRVVAYSLLEESPVSLEMAKTILKDMVTESARVITVESIQKQVAGHFHLSLTELKAKRRHKNIILPRQITMYLCRKLTNLSLPEIGQAFGGKDHTTVLHAYNKISKEILVREDLKSLIKKLSTQIKG